MQPSGDSPLIPPNPQALLGLTSISKSIQQLGVEAKRHLTDNFN